MIDILNIEPTKVSKDLQGKYILLYGAPKIGHLFLKHLIYGKKLED